MGLHISVAGKNSSLYLDNKEEINGLISDICRQTNRSQPFELGTINRKSQQSDMEKVGRFTSLIILRRYAAYLEFDGEPPILSGAEDDSCLFLDQIDQRLIQSNKFAQLINQNQAGGYYLPIDFPEPLYLKQSSYFEPSLVGSSQRLLTELELINTFLQMPTDMIPESNAFYEFIDGDPWSIEKRVWVLFYYFTKQSIAQNLILCFG